MFTGSDFKEIHYKLLVPQSTNGHSTFGTLPLDFGIVIINDNINENKQSLVLVAQVTEETPEDVVCFMRHGRDSECHGNVGATLINIIDDDCKCD